MIVPEFCGSLNMVIFLFFISCAILNIILFLFVVPIRDTRVPNSFGKIEQLIFCINVFFVIKSSRKKP